MMALSKAIEFCHLHNIIINKIIILFMLVVNRKKKILGYYTVF